MPEGRQKIGIVTDSAVCIPEELIRKYDIRMVPEIIIFGDTEYRDGIDLQRHEFYDMLKKAEEIPTTSAPSPDDFIETFRNASRNRDGIVCILVTAGFSSMGFKSASQALDALPDIPIQIVDSRTAVGAYGFIVLAAARAAAEGASLQEVVDAAEEMKKRVNMVATLNTLKYLAKGGRIGKAAHWAGNVLNIKPVISVPTSTGVLEPLDRVMSRKKALLRLLEIVETTAANGSLLHASIDHAAVPEEAGWLKNQLVKRYDRNDISINDWAPVAGVHCGLGVIGISYYTD
ncbi:MAG: DegV family protein [Dehalococcoidales bacterium]|nr:DegV family protein [Dehalococcoidales bacterium]